MTENKPLEFLLAFLVSILIAGSLSLHAQVAPAATRNGISLSAGAMLSGFQPDYGPNDLGGVGVFADLNVFHGLGVEAEGRWLHFNEFEKIRQENYLVGPRFQLRHIARATPYIKVLAGEGRMVFENDFAIGRFTDIAYGGGVDVRITRQISIRAVDVEFQQWPKFLGGSLYPAGISAGVSYRIF